MGTEDYDEDRTPKQMDRDAYHEAEAIMERIHQLEYSLRDPAERVVVGWVKLFLRLTINRIYRRLTKTLPPLLNRMDPLGKDRGT